MSELKAGGLALVIQSTVPEQVGKAVTLLQFISPGDFIHNGKKYFSKASSGTWLCEKPDALVTHYPWQLMPIDGDDFSHEDERRRELTHG